ncbi:MerR family transcriptional regulator [Heliobacterium gestii]|uniref:MerR family transcriptional regulator n=1 Tax=Heliomicrobium gestii TaxID=2699 RepID=A0A845LGU0_HELGE|nr:MerR family transcriptional regulator [Heliomicrobium gestii]MBM7868489.1 DNA-binding transcriptional MerR regulator [Heliomicrobium gestii]MZP44644.1 MerR family transcriptional regulator [Heliomicrobium gestii]
MRNHVKISDFVTLTGSTLKTIIYYHKIGLLPEPERSAGGYRLYGAAELRRMHFIKHFKSLGLDLKRIKEILGDKHDAKTLREVLETLRMDLLSEKKSLEERLAQIELLLREDKDILEEDICDSPSFQMITEILKPVQVANYQQTCPELFEQQRKLFGLIDDFQWGEDHRDTFRALAEYFQAHPEQYQNAIDLGARLSKLSQLTEDDPEIEKLARESTEFIKTIPQLRALLCNRQGIKRPLTGVYNDMAATVLSPARMKHMQLFQKYLNS